VMIASIEPDSAAALAGLKVGDILLGLDDTIIDDSSSVDGGWRTAIVEHTRGIDVQSLVDAVCEVRDWYWSDAERHRVGRQDLNAASTCIVAEALRRLGRPDAERAGKIANRYRELREQGQALLPGAIEAIEKLRQHDIRLALLTNGSAAVQRAKIDRFDLARHFDYVCIEGEFGCGKPDERVYRGAPFFDLICCATCHAIASPSRSGSVARKISLESRAADFRSATVFSLPGIVTYSGSKPFSMSIPIFFSGRSRT